jgi:hypothetical protein
VPKSSGTLFLRQYPSNILNKKPKRKFYLVVPETKTNKPGTITSKAKSSRRGRHYFTQRWKEETQNKLHENQFEESSSGYRLKYPSSDQDDDCCREGM